MSTSRQDISNTHLSAVLRNLDGITQVDLSPELAAATKEKPCKENFFLMLMRNIILDVNMQPQADVKRHGLKFYPHKHREVVDGITSILGHYFLTKHDDTETDHEGLDCYYQLWTKQAAPLEKFQRRIEDRVKYHNIMMLLVPKRLLPICQTSRHLDLLNHVVIGCGLHPANLSLNISELYDTIHKFKVYYSANEDYLVFLKSLVSRTVILALKEVSNKQFEVLQCIFESVVGNRNNTSTLKALEMNFSSDGCKKCTNINFLSPYLFILPQSGPPSLPFYQGLCVLEFASPLPPTSLSQATILIQQQNLLEHVSICVLDSCQDHSVKTVLTSEVENNLYKTLASLFGRERFQFLKIQFYCRVKNRTSNCSTLFPFTKLLQSSMVSHCTHNQTLCFENLPQKVSLGSLTFNIILDDTQVSECASQHKILLYDFAGINVIIPSLLRLSIIRLQEFTFSYMKGNQSLFHKVAQHRDLNVSKLRINFDFDTMIEELSTICQDFERLFQMPTLEEVLLSGDWLNFSEIKSAIVINWLATTGTDLLPSKITFQI